MHYVLKAVLSPEQLREVRGQLANVHWSDGRLTAGTQAEQVKNNDQLPDAHPITAKIRQMVLEALSQSPAFFSAALPKRIFPPLINRYAGSRNAFGDHVDNAIRTHASSARHVRSDLSFTLFLNDPQEYEGGDLIIQGEGSSTGFKLGAGDLLLYNAGALHRVQAVTRGERLACFSWVESMVQDPAQRQLLHDLDLNIISLREEFGDVKQAIQFTATYHNLLRMWARV